MPIQPAKGPSPEIRVAIQAWNFMGGLDWAAVPVAIDLFGFKDPEVFLAQMTAIRDHLREK